MIGLYALLLLTSGVVLTGGIGLLQLDPKWLAPFLARHQGIGADGNARALRDRLSQLLCCPLPAGLWESEVLPARLPGYKPGDLDRLLNESELQWLGHGKGHVAFCFETDLDLMRPDGSAFPRARRGSGDKPMDGRQRPAGICSRFAGGQEAGGKA